MTSDVSSFDTFRKMPLSPKTKSSRFERTTLEIASGIADAAMMRLQPTWHTAG